MIFTDVNVEKPSEEAILMYVSALKQAFPDMPPPHRKKVSVVMITHVVLGIGWLSHNYGI